MEAKWLQVQRLLQDLFPRPEEKKSSLPGLRYPSLRDEPLKSPDLWLKGKRQDDNAEGLWRVHDDLYDFTNFIDNHPGGSYWLSVTKGTDITEAFEVHHISQTPASLLKTFHVGPATGPRNSPYTFHDDGFYRTLKSKVRKVLSDNPPGPPWKSMAIADLLLLSSLTTAVMAAFTFSFLLGIVSGVLLSLTTVSAHNFFHQRDNFRMYYFDLSFMSSRNWRVSHSMSHHLYTNTLLDLEISMVEPFLQYLPRSSKPWWVRYGAWVASPFVYTLTFHSQLLTRIALIVAGYRNILKKEDVLPLVIPALMLCSACGVLTAVLMWTWIVLVASFSFGFIGLNAAHHHPELFHDGDAPRTDRDWGLGQVDAVRDRPEISASLFLVLVTFGDHCLHHLFPTVDHSHLPALYPVFYETCKKFGIEYQPTSVFDLVRGQFQQLTNNTPNPDPPGTEATVPSNSKNTPNSNPSGTKTIVPKTASNTRIQSLPGTKTTVPEISNNTPEPDPPGTEETVPANSKNTSNSDLSGTKTAVPKTASNTHIQNFPGTKTTVPEMSNNTPNPDLPVIKTTLPANVNNTSNSEPPGTKTVPATDNNTPDPDSHGTEETVPANSKSTSNSDLSGTKTTVPEMSNNAPNPYLPVIKTTVPANVNNTSNSEPPGTKTVPATDNNTNDQDSHGTEITVPENVKKTINSDLSGTETTVKENANNTPKPDPPIIK